MTASFDRNGMAVLDEHRCFELLRSTSVGRLAFVTATGPEIFPVNFIVDHGSVVFRTAEGTKLSAIVGGVQVAFEADGHDASGPDPGEGSAWSVVLKGRAAEITGMHERFAAAELPLFSWSVSPKGHFVRIEANEITGRQFAVVEESFWSAGRHTGPIAAVE